MQTELPVDMDAAKKAASLALAGIGLLARPPTSSIPNPGPTQPSKKPATVRQPVRSNTTSSRTESSSAQHGPHGVNSHNSHRMRNRYATDNFQYGPTESRHYQHPQNIPYVVHPGGVVPDPVGPFGYARNAVQPFIPVPLLNDLMFVQQAAALNSLAASAYNQQHVALAGMPYSSSHQMLQTQLLAQQRLAVQQQQHHLHAQSLAATQQVLGHLQHIGYQGHHAQQQQKVALGLRPEAGANLFGMAGAAAAADPASKSASLETSGLLAMYESVVRSTIVQAQQQGNKELESQLQVGQGAMMQGGPSWQDNNAACPSHAWCFCLVPGACACACHMRLFAFIMHGRCTPTTRHT